MKCINKELKAKQIDFEEVLRPLLRMANGSRLQLFSKLSRRNTLSLGIA